MAPWSKAWARLSSHRPQRPGRGRRCGRGPRPKPRPRPRRRSRRRRRHRPRPRRRPVPRHRRRPQPRHRRRPQPRHRRRARRSSAAAPTTTTTAPSPIVTIATAPPTTAPAPLVTTTTTTTTTAPAPAPAPTGPGMVGGLGFAGGLRCGRRQRRETARRLDGIAATGAPGSASTSTGPGWSRREARSTSATWTGSSRPRGSRSINVLAILAYTPAWARPPGRTRTIRRRTPRTSPTSRGDRRPLRRCRANLGDLERTQPLRVLAARGEPGRLHGAPERGPRRNQRDPGATVLSGGTAPAPDGNGSYSPLTFLTGVYNAGGPSTSTQWRITRTTIRTTPCAPRPTSTGTRSAVSPRSSARLMGGPG